MAHKPRTQPGSVRAATAAVALEWYVILVFGMTAPGLLAPVFFPTNDPVVGSFYGFVAFALAFVLRPVGALIFRTTARRLGERRSHLTALVIQGLSMVAIGLLPSFASAGIAATYALVGLRVVQGIALGGEWRGPTSLGLVNAASSREHTASVQQGVPIAHLLAALLITGAALLPRSAVLSWGWRIPFLAAAILAGVAIWWRAGTPDEASRRTGEADAGNVRRVLREVPIRTLVLLGASLASLTTFITGSVVLVGYATAVAGMPLASVMWSATFGALVALLLLRFVRGWIRRWDAGRTSVAATVAAAGVAFLVFWLADLRDGFALTVAMGLALAVNTVAAVPLGAMVPVYIGHRSVVTARGMVTTVAAVLAGVVPAVGCALLYFNQRSPLGPALLTSGVCLVSAGCLEVMRRHMR